ncbi:MULTISPECIES: hypothetical protein [Paenibacillus]|uniref:hypothetical protein n=1 Tax=Paenibacillus TaxID=44249 RepID=UPI00096F27F7|nr:hypothetical protein [Paenibacillus odorifer]OME18712.1 hypothetical protein BSK60_01345 [Paenibacillus odorifer]
MSLDMILWLDYKATENHFLEQLKLVEDKPFELHFVYNKFIKLYSMHLIQPDAAKKLISVCLKDIELFPKFKEAWFARNPDYNFIPNIPSFQKLAIFYENKGLFYEAIDICHVAIEYGAEDKTKGGYTTRILRLEKKLEKQLREN